MSNTIKHTILIAVLALAIAARPEQGIAQRFNHGGGGSFSRPAPMPAPAPRMAAPPPAPAPRMAPPAPAPRMAPPTPAPRMAPPPQAFTQRMGAPVPRPALQQQAPPTINGGVRNFGNHDFNRPAPVIYDNVNVRNTVNIHDHPYHPHYWGPRWHPVGFFQPALTAGASWFDLNNQRYYYDDGCYYLPGNGGYSVVPPPIGAVVGSLPDGYETPMVGNDTYYYFGGAFYVAIDQGYQVVDAPPGAVVTQLPAGAVDQLINGQDLLMYNNVYYLPVSQDGQDAYEVITP